MTNKQPKTDFLHCQACSHKFILDDSLVEISLNNVPGGIPYIDKDDNKVKMPPMQKRRRMFKCPKCGKGVVGKALTTPSKDYIVVSDRKVNNTNPVNPRS